MAEDNDDQNPNNTDDLAGVPQDQVNRLLAAERRETERKAMAKVADQLGCSVDEAKTIIDERNKARADAKDEATRLRDEAAEAKRLADEDRASAQAERFAAKVERRLIAAGVPDTALTRAARMVTLASDADDDAIAAEIDALKAEIPALFTPTGTPVTGPGVPAAKPPPVKVGGQTKTMAELGQETLRKAGIRPRTAA